MNDRNRSRWVLSGALIVAFLWGTAAQISFPTRPSKLPGSSLELIDATGAQVGTVVDLQANTVLGSVTVLFEQEQRMFFFEIIRHRVFANTSLVYPTPDCTGPAFLRIFPNSASEDFLFPKASIDRTGMIWVADLGVSEVEMAARSSHAGHYPGSDFCAPIDELVPVLPGIPVEMIEELVQLPVTLRAAR